MEEGIGKNDDSTMESNGNAIITLVEKYVNVGKTVTLPLCGFSMRPFLEDNRDRALLSAPPETLRIGDVILARLGRRNKFVLHRITGIDGDRSEERRVGKECRSRW